ncbi:SUMF1/EgtB/PvdO family nonheme iron enzyme [bacterium]|nr:SUMF1/EgtB/PvdO family nonheme iron enzyme [bacterium]
MNGKRNTDSDQLKEDAVRLIVENGHSFKQVSLMKGISEAYLQNWHAELAPQLVWAKVESNSDKHLLLPNGTPIHFKEIAGGSFRMGTRGAYHTSEPIHEVYIPAKFYLGVFPVTQHQFEEWKFANPGVTHQNVWSGSEFYPVDSVSWHQAREFCQWLNQVCIADLDGYWVDLPTEAHWEFACIGDAELDCGLGDGKAALQEMGWIGDSQLRGTKPVGLKRPNHGLYDMHGNVREWCRDHWDPFAYRYWIDGMAVPTMRHDLSNTADSPRVVRGGSWANKPDQCTAAFRTGMNAKEADERTGIRIGLFAKGS